MPFGFFSFFSNKQFGTFGDDALAGGSGKDKLFGLFGDDLLEGNGGNDQLFASFGDDTLNGGEGNDKMFGGKGHDTAVFSGSIFDYSWSDPSKYKVTVTDLNAADGDAGTDKLYSIEALQFDDYTLSLKDNNGPLVIAGDGATDEDTAATFTLQAFDFDGDTLTLDSVSVTGGGAVSVAQRTVASAQGTAVEYDVSFDPSGAYEALGVGESAVETVTLQVSDGQGGVTTQTFDVTINGVNDGPTAGDDTGAADSNAAAVISVLGNDTDPDANDVLTISSFDAVSAKGGLVTDNGDGTFSYDPNGQFDGLTTGATDTDTFTYTISDGNGGFDTATVTVTVTGVNAAPVANDDAVLADEDAVTVIDALDNDTDADPGDVLSVTAFDAVSAKGGIVTDNGDGTFDYDPNGQFNALAAGESETDTFSYTISDGKGGTDTATVTVTIQGANDGPTAGDDSGTTDEDSAVSITVDANDSDPDATNVLTISAFDAVSAKGGIVTDNGDGTFSYDPNGQFEGLGEGASDTDTFTYTVSDGNGGTATATVTVKINGLNDAPSAPGAAVTITEDESTVIDLLDGLVDADGDALSVSAVDATSALGVTLEVREAGQVSYTPLPSLQALAVGASVTDTFTYTVSDGNGGFDTATVTITIEGANDAPDAADDGAVTPLDALVIINALGNDSDIDTGDVLTVSSFTQPENGRVVDLGGGQFEYTPRSGFQGTDSFTYTVSDGNGGFDTASVNVTVGNAANTPPVALDAVLEFDNSGLVVLDFNTLTVGGRPIISDLEQSTAALTITAIDVTTGGRFTAEFIETGADTDIFTLDPSGLPVPEGGALTLTVTYVVDDGQGGSDGGTIDLTIRDDAGPVNQAPIAADATFTQDEDGGLINVSILIDPDPENSPPDALASDPDGDTLTVTALSFFGAGGRPLTFDPLEDSGSVLTDGSFFIDPLVFGLEDGENGVFTAVYTVSDGDLSTSGTITFDITGTALNNAPVAEDAAITLTDPDDVITFEGARFEVDLNPLVSDADGDELTITVNSVVDDNGTPEDASDDVPVTFSVLDGVISLFTFNLSLNPGETDNLIIDYSVSDGALSDGGVVDLTLIGADLPPAGPVVEDFESFAPAEGFSQEISDILGLRVETGSITVFETDEIIDASGGRGVAPGFLNGQTTTGGDNVAGLVGQYLSDDSSGLPLYASDFYAADGSVNIDAGFPTFEQNFGEAFDLKGLSLTLLEGGPEVVTIIPYRLIGPSQFQRELGEVVPGGFDVGVSSTGALTLDFDDLQFLGFDDPNTTEVESSAFENIHAFRIVTTGELEAISDPRGNTTFVPNNDDVLIVDDFIFEF